MNYRYPKSFPDESERRFFAVLFSDNETFHSALKHWTMHESFDDTPIAISRLLPLLYQRITSQKESILTPSIHNKIKGIYKLAWYKNQLLLKDLQQVLNRCNQSSIPVILLKGSALLATSHNNPTMSSDAPAARFQNDIDILVEPHHIRKLINLFRRDGWHFTDPQFALIEPLPDEKLFVTTKEVTFSKKDCVDVDIHWRIIETDHSGTFTESVWNAAQHQSFSEALNGCSAFIPADEDLLLHILIHGAYKNNVRPIRWVSDALSLIQKGSINWNRFFKQVTNHSFHAEAYCALHYLHEFHPDLIPAAATTGMSTLQPTRQQMRKYFSKTDTLSVPLFGNLGKLWHGYRTENHNQSLMRYFAHHWKLPSPYHIPLFVSKKVWGRIINTLHQLGLFLNLTKRD